MCEGTNDAPRWALAQRAVRARQARRPVVQRVGVGVDRARDAVCTGDGHRGVKVVAFIRGAGVDAGRRAHSHSEPVCLHVRQLRRSQVVG